MDLNEIIGFDTLPVLVNEDGTITEGITNVTAPEAGSYGADFEYVVTKGIDGWYAIRDSSNQSGYYGPVFHPSEYIGESLSQMILETPGYWAVEEVYVYDDDSDALPYGWVLLHKPLD